MIQMILSFKLNKIKSDSIENRGKNTLFFFYHKIGSNSNKTVSYQMKLKQDQIVITTIIRSTEVIIVNWATIETNRD
jgi:hypothetical protein